MKVRELKALCPVVAVAELQEDARYLVTVRTPCSIDSLTEVRHWLQEAGLKNVAVVPDNLKFYEIVES